MGAREGAFQGDFGKDMDRIERTRFAPRPTGVSTCRGTGDFRAPLAHLGNLVPERGRYRSQSSSELHDPQEEKPLMARRQLSAEDEARLAQLYSRLTLILHFIEDVEDFPSGPQVREVVAAAMNQRDLRTLRLIERDVEEMAHALSPGERERLQTQLRNAAAGSSDLGRIRAHQEVVAILARGRVGSEKERRRLEQYADELNAEAGADTETIEAIQRLLAK